MANGYRDPYGYLRQTMTGGMPMARPVQRAIQPAPMPPTLPAAPTAGAVRGGGVGRMMQAVPGGLAAARQRAQQARAAESLLMPETPSAPEAGLLGAFAPGTPSAAGLGAAGRELLRLGGPQRTPLSLGQILGQAAGVGLEAFKTREQEMAEAQRQKVLAERDAQKFGMEQLKGFRELYGPQSASGKKALDEGLAYGSPEYYARVAQLNEAAGKDVSVEIGITPEGQMPLTKTQASAQQKKLIETQSSIDALAAINEAYRPEFLEIPTQLWIKASRGVERLGIGIGDESRQLLRDYSEFQRQSAEAMNAYIRSVTGAQMSIYEADRILKAMPNPDKDSPTEFKAKLDNAIKMLRLAEARSKYYLSKGVDMGDENKYIKATRSDDPLNVPEETLAGLNIREDVSFVDDDGKAVSISGFERQMINDFKSEVKSSKDAGDSDADARAKGRQFILSKYGYDIDAGGIQ